MPAPVTGLVQSRKKTLAKWDKKEKPSAPLLEFSSLKRSRKYVLGIEDLSFGYGRTGRSFKRFGQHRPRTGCRHRKNGVANSSQVLAGALAPQEAASRVRRAAVPGYFEPDQCLT